MSADNPTKQANPSSAVPGLSWQQLKELTHHLMCEGKLIEAGFAGLRIACVLEDSPADQLYEMRFAFFAGAQHLFASMMTMLDPGSEPTAADMVRMSQIDAELRAFIREFELRHFPAKGAA